MKAVENIHWAKDEGVDDESTITRCFKKFHSSCKNLDDQETSSRPKCVDFKAVLRAVEANSESIKQICHFTVQFGISLSQHQEFLNCT